MKKKLVITVDTNDADYVTRVSDIDDVTLTALLPVFIAIKKFKPYTTQSVRETPWRHSNNWPTGDCLREDLGEKSPEEIYKDVLTSDQIEIFFEYAPRCGSEGFHTVESVEVFTVANEFKYL